MSINWKEWPLFNHEGRWVQKYQSIMNPEAKVTWPQLIAEFVVYWRSAYIKNFPKITKGKGWSSAIQKQVRDLNQQAATICGYFPHPDDEPLVFVAVKKYFREQKPLKIGQHRKNRIYEKNGKQYLNITQSEKDVVLGINAELAKLVKHREAFQAVAPIETKENPTYAKSDGTLKKRGSLAFLLNLEKELKAQEAEKDKDV